jgi:hypothetical protein
VYDRSCVFLRLALVAAVAACGRIDFDSRIGVGADAAADAAQGASCGGTSTCPGFAILCDGFEGATLDPQWSVTMTNGVPAVDGAMVCRGHNAVRASVNAIASGTASASVLAMPSYTRGTLFARVYVYIPSATAPDSSMLSWNLMQLYHAANPSYGLELGIRVDAFHVTNFEPTTVELDSPIAWPRDRWACVEWQVDFPSADGVADAAVDVWLDGVPVSGLSPAPGLVLPPSAMALDVFEIGLAGYGSPVAQPAATVWLDEVVLASQRIGCAS